MSAIKRGPLLSMCSNFAPNCLHWFCAHTYQPWTFRTTVDPTVPCCYKSTIWMWIQAHTYARNTHLRLVCLCGDKRNRKSCDHSELRSLYTTGFVNLVTLDCKQFKKNGNKMLKERCSLTVTKSWFSKEIIFDAMETDGECQEMWGWGERKEKEQTIVSTQQL